MKAKAKKSIRRQIRISFATTCYARITIWSAPVVWEFLYSLMTLWFGLASLWGATFREPNLNWIVVYPYYFIPLIFGIFGLVVTPLRYHLLHMIHVIGNVFLFSLIFITYCLNSMLRSQTTGVYGLVMLGAIWLAIRTAADRRILVDWKDSLK